MTELYHELMALVGSTKLSVYDSTTASYLQFPSVFSKSLQLSDEPSLPSCLIGLRDLIVCSMVPQLHLNENESSYCDNCRLMISPLLASTDDEISLEDCNMLYAGITIDIIDSYNMLLYKKSFPNALKFEYLNGTQYSASERFKVHIEISTQDLF